MWEANVKCVCELDVFYIVYFGFETLLDLALCVCGYSIYWEFLSHSSSVLCPLLDQSYLSSHAHLHAITMLTLASW